MKSPFPVVAGVRTVITNWQVRRTSTLLHLLSILSRKPNETCGFFVFWAKISMRGKGNLPAKHAKNTKKAENANGSKRVFVISPIG